LTDSKSILNVSEGNKLLALMENNMVLDETMNVPDDSLLNLNPQLAPIPIWNDNAGNGNEAHPFFLFDDDDIDEEDMDEDENFDDMDDDFDDDFDDDEDDFEDEEDDYEDEDEDYDYEEDVDYDDFDD